MLYHKHVRRGTITDENIGSGGKRIEKRWPGD